MLSVTEESLLSKPTDLVQGTLDLLILKVIASNPIRRMGHGGSVFARMFSNVLQVGQETCTRPFTSSNERLDQRRMGDQQTTVRVLHAHKGRA